jgi:steroid delta-isomerase-like uncharacterized protein
MCADVQEDVMADSPNKKVVVRWFEEVWNKGRADAVDGMFTVDGLAHGLGPTIRGPAEFKVFHAAFRDAMPDMRIEIQDLIEEGDQVAYRWTASATHTGSGLGFAATNRRAEFQGLGIVRIRNGQIVEGWNAFDRLGLFQQLGVVNVPG